VCGRRRAWRRELGRGAFACVVVVEARGEGATGGSIGEGSALVVGVGVVVCGLEASSSAATSKARLLVRDDTSARDWLWFMASYVQARARSPCRCRSRAPATYPRVLTHHLLSLASPSSRSPLPSAPSPRRVARRSSVAARPSSASPSTAQSPWRMASWTRVSLYVLAARVVLASSSCCVCCSLYSRESVVFVALPSFPYLP